MLKEASKSPLTLTSLTWSYQDLRGFCRNFCCDLPISISKVHLTSAEVNGLQSCPCTPRCSLKVRVLLSPLQAQLSARSGTISLMLFWALFWSYITRLLNTGMNGT